MQCNKTLNVQNLQWKVKNDTYQTWDWSYNAVLI